MAIDAKQWTELLILVDEICEANVDADVASQLITAASDWPVMFTVTAGDVRKLMQLRRELESQDLIKALDKPKCPTNDDNEVVVQLSNGCSIRSGVYEPGPDSLTCGEYVRVCDPNGEEAVYWDSAEWEEDPVLVMGAIINSAYGLRVEPAAPAILSEFARRVMNQPEPEDIDLSKHAGLMWVYKFAEKHGIDSEPDHEVGDLQYALEAAWDMLNPAQQQKLLERCREEWGDLPDGEEAGEAETERTAGDAAEDVGGLSGPGEQTPS